MGASSRVRAGLLAAAIVASASLAACDALLGLGDFSDVACAKDCDAGRETSVPDASDAGDASDGAQRETSIDAVSDVPVPDATELWARWRMPNPEAAIAPGADAQLPNQMTYDASVDGAVYDEVTGLTWEATGVAVKSLNEAWGHCSGEWRVPTRIELVSLIDFTRAYPAIDPVFSGVPSDAAAPYWSASVVQGDAGGGYWVVDFSDGLVEKGGASWVRCVKGGP